MEISRIYLEEQLLRKYYVVRHLVLPKIQNIMDINTDLLQWFKNFLTANTSGGAIMPKQQLAEELTQTNY